MISSFEDQSTILIIDDSVAAIRILADMLKDMGKIIFATSGETGLKLAHEHLPQLILLDGEMPLMNGYQVCQTLQANPLTREASVIFVTAENTTESEINALEVGAVDFITKPLNQFVVRARVRTQLKLQQQSAVLKRLANRDGLTGLYNRRYFDEMIEQEFDRHKRQGLSLGLALIDIDFFKKYNDFYGHLEGDTCLKKVATVLGESTMRSGEFVARYGGEEFVAVLPYTTAEHAVSYSDKLCQRIRSLDIPHHDNVGSVVTISVGVSATVPDASTSILQLIDEADKALYHSKSTGRGRSTAWSSIAISAM